MTSKIYLRAIELSDCQRIHEWHNNPDLYKTLIGSFHPVSMVAVENWLRNRVSYSEKEANFAICLTETSEHIGNIYLRDIDYVNRNGRHGGLFIGKSDCRGKGLGVEAMIKMNDYAFQVLGLQRVWGYVFEDNLVSCRMLDRCGFKVEGKMRNHVLKDGTFKDILVVGICRDDYEKVKTGRL